MLRNLFKEKHLNMKNINNTDREPAVAGQFYPANADVLQKEVESYFRDAIEKKYDNVRAIICPHAGYIFQGRLLHRVISRSMKKRRTSLCLSWHRRIIFITTVHRYTATAITGCRMVQ